MLPSVKHQALLALVLSASIASTIGGLPFNTLPVLLGSMADSFALNPGTVGLIGSVCFAGYLVGTLGAPFWMDRVDWRLFTVIAAAGTAASLCVSAMASRIELLYVIWACIGFFSSTMTSLGMRILSVMADKVRAFGVRQGIELSITAAVLFALPPLIISNWKYPGAAFALALLVVVLGLSAFWVPRRAETNAIAPAAAGTVLPAASWLTLCVFFVFLVGNIALWAFLERIGTSLRIASAEMGLVFAVLKLLGGIAAFSAAVVGERYGRRAPYLLIAIGLGTGLFLLASGKTFIPFALGAWIWEFFFTCGCVFQTAAIARSDPGGRAIVLVPGAFALASMVAPGLGGYLFGDGGTTALLAIAFGSSLVPIIVYSLWNPAPDQLDDFLLAKRQET